jgi:hypothetical protein
MALPGELGAGVMGDKNLNRQRQDGVGAAPADYAKVLSGS